MTRRRPSSSVPARPFALPRCAVFLCLFAANACEPGALPGEVCLDEASCPPAEPTCPGDPSCPPDVPGAVDLAAAGPCGQEASSFANPLESANLVHVFAPTGSVAAPLTGGTCDDAARPVLFFAHGHMANHPELFVDLIGHFVSQGHILVFAEYRGLDAIDLDGDAYPIVDAGFAAATEQAVIVERGDLSRVGFMGHSMGGGMVPYLLQQAEPRGWGSASIWAVLMAPYWALAVGAEPKIDVPAGLRALVVSFDRDGTNDNAIAAEIFEALDVPDADKEYVLVRSDEYGDPDLLTHHTLPQTLESTSDGSPRPDDALRIHGIYRNTNALASCAMFGSHCDVDLTFMGTWPDGEPVAPATTTDDPADSGTSALVSCGNVSNPRNAYCP